MRAAAAKIIRRREAAPTRDQVAAGIAINGYGYSYSRPFSAFSQGDYMHAAGTTLYYHYYRLSRVKNRVFSEDRIPPIAPP